MEEHIFLLPAFKRSKLGFIINSDSDHTFGTYCAMIGFVHVSLVRYSTKKTMTMSNFLDSYNLLMPP